MMMKAKTLAKGAGYVAWFIACVLAFTYMTFPMDRVRSFVERKASEGLGARVTIDDIELDGLSGVILHGIEIKKKVGAKPQEPDVSPSSATEEKVKEAEPENNGTGPAPESEEPTISPVATRIDYAELRTDLLALLGDDPKTIEGEVEAFGGSVREIQIQIDDGTIDINIPEIDGVRLDDIGAVQAALPYPLTGTLNGKVTIAWKKKLYDSTASIDLRIDDAVLVSPVIKSPNYGNFELTDIHLGSVALIARLGRKQDFPELRALAGPPDQTIVHIERFDATGNDIELVSEDRNVIQLVAGGTFGAGTLVAGFAFHLKDSFFDRIAKRDGVDETPNRFLRTIMNTDKRFKLAEKNGYYGLSCGGTIKKPDCELNRPNVRVGVQRATPGGAFGNPAGAPEGEVPPEAGLGEEVAPEVPEPIAREERGSMAIPRPEMNPVSSRARPEPVAPRAEGRSGEEPVRMNIPSSADDARQRLEELRRQREERMNQLREERSRLSAIREPEPTEDFGVPIGEPPVEELELPHPAEEGVIPEPIEVEPEPEGQEPEGPEPEGGVIPEIGEESAIPLEGEVY